MKESVGTPSSSSSWHLEQGPYIGDVSALCFIKLNPQAQLPYLLAGIGAQLLLYDIEPGLLVLSAHVFDGLRIHGIHSSCWLFEDTNQACYREWSVPKVAVYGEKRVKIFKIQTVQTAAGEESTKKCFSLIPLQIVPKFNHWVMDVRFLKGLNKDATGNEYEEMPEFFGNILVIGLGDNSVHFWDIAKSCLLFEINCTERCLLYSMSLWGDSVDTLRVASGTIFNEVLIWNVVSESNFLRLRSDMLNSSKIDVTQESTKFLQYHSIVLKKLVGHEGSIFRIAWSHDGSKCISASDDRSARIWICAFEQGVGKTLNASCFDIVAGPILFGHGARIWDCYISDTIIITASEDCSCRVWSANGKQIETFKGHIGRGVWRCAYHMASSLLVTAGSDSSIKLRHLDTKTMRLVTHKTGKADAVDENMELFVISLDNGMAVRNSESLNSKSEYVRCLHLVQESCIFVATNQGYLYCFDLICPGQEKCTTIFKVKDKQPIICLDIHVAKQVNGTDTQENWAAFGDGKGKATVVQLLTSNLKHDLIGCFDWNAEKERQLLGIFWSESLGHRFVFTTDPKGGLKLWRLDSTIKNASKSHEHLEDMSLPGMQVLLLAKFQSDLLARVVCLNATYVSQVLFCGDQRGNIIVFNFPTKLLHLDSVVVEEQFQNICSFKGAHGISSVSSLHIKSVDSGQIRICSTGKDGCICEFIYDQGVEDVLKSLIFAGVKNVPEINMAESFVEYLSTVDMVSSKYVTGFTAADFLLWDLTNDSEVLKVACGGWRRPHSYFIGSMPEIQNCFAYTKDNNIHVVRNWVPEAHLKRFPQAVHTQFHGREIHSVHFIPSCVNSQLHHCSNSNMGLYWIATGGEDGTVRLTRYTSKGGDKINLSMPLEEHVGGSAVRSVTCVSEIYPLYSKPEYHTKQDASSMNKDAPLLLFSAGAKQVLTCWLLKWKNHTSGFHNDSLIENSVDCSHEVEVDNSMISSQWLTSYMQPRINKTSRKASMTNQLEKVTNAELGKVLPAVIREDSKQGGMNTSRESSVCIDEIEDDWRYLAVTAFLVQPPDTRLTICFVVMSCSNATLSLQALVLPKRIWYEVAVLEHEPAPVLALQHAIIPFHLPDKATDTYQNAYLAFSGTTTGTVSVWDLTYLVNDFCHKATNQNPGDPKMALKRPQTGRGSQGGRRWRISRQKHEFQIGLTKKSKIEESGINQEMENNTADSVTEESSQDSNPSEHTSTGQFAETRNYLEQCQMHLPTTDLVDDTENPVSKVEKGAEIATAHPIHVFHNVHQSEVNCLHVSHLSNKGMQEMHNFDFNYCIVSGGDDQALHVACFCLHLLEQEKDHAAKVESNPYIYSGISSSFASSKQKYDSVNIKVSESHKGDFKSAEISKYVFKCIDQQSVKSAHNSSIKGVWTDGHWVFSTGLDQRVRCWNLMFSNSCCSLRECCNSIVSVPEPETLHATLDHQRNCYKIAIAGRGMQIIEFLT